MSSRAIEEKPGARYGRLTVIERKENNKHKIAMYLCKCDCGNEKVIKGTALRNGTTKSCGCYQRDVASATAKVYIASENFKPPTRYRHGYANTRLFEIWCRMRERCTNPAKDHYDRYGGRGIKVCNEWMKDFVPFKEWALANGYQDNLSIDRIDNDGDYSPDNCRWATQSEQCRNRSNTVKLTHNGETKPLADWSELYGVKYKLAHERYKKGWPFERIMGLKEGTT